LILCETHIQFFGSQQVPHQKKQRPRLLVPKKQSLRVMVTSNDLGPCNGLDAQYLIKAYGLVKSIVCSATRSRSRALAIIPKHFPPYLLPFPFLLGFRKRLGGGGNLLSPFPGKPKGMHWKTYQRLKREAIDAQIMSWMIIDQRLDPLVVSNL
jgi:hypothetical protein